MERSAKDSGVEKREIHIGRALYECECQAGENPYYNVGKVRDIEGFHFFNNTVSGFSLYDVAQLRPDRNWKNPPEFISRVAQYEK